MLAPTNALIILLIAGLYGVGASAAIPKAAFQILLAAFVIVAAAVWVRVERRRLAARPPLDRIFRVLGALAIALVATPIAVLMPLLWVAGGMTPNTGMELVVQRVMGLLLVGEVVAVAINVLGAIVALGTTLALGRSPNASAR